MPAPDASRPRVVVLTGPSGAGKTTVAALLARDAARPTVDLRTDLFYSAIATGGVEPYLPEAHAQNETVVDAIVAAAGVYARGGYDVVVDGVVGTVFLPPFLAAAGRGGWDLHYVVLRPTLGVTLARGAARPEGELRDPAVLSVIHGSFTDLHRTEPDSTRPDSTGPDSTGPDGIGLGDLEGHVVDSSDHTPAETVQAVRDGLASGRFRVAVTSSAPEHPRTDPPLRADELSTLRAFLDYHRDTLRLKTAGLGSAGLDTTLPPSTMTLGGLLKHLAFVESNWFAEVFDGDAPLPPFDTADWDADRDWEWHSAPDDTPAELRELFDVAVGDSDRRLDAVLAAGGTLDRASTKESRRPGEGAFSLRWILVHLIEEYARHNGHADLLREAVDGATGE